MLHQVRPLRRQLTGLKAWITGQRKDQSPGTRAAVPVVQVDPVFEGLDGGKGSLVKFNPLSNVSSAEVWNFLRIMVRTLACSLTLQCVPHVSHHSNLVSVCPEVWMFCALRVPLVFQGAEQCVPCGSKHERSLVLRQGQCSSTCLPTHLFAEKSLPAHRPSRHLFAVTAAGQQAYGGRRTCRQMSCTRAGTSPSGASRARARCCPTSMSARGAGGGRCTPIFRPLLCSFGPSGGYLWKTPK